MRELQHDDRQEWTGRDAHTAIARPAPERRLHYRIAKGAVTASPRSTVGALAATRSDWLLHGRERTEEVTPVASPTEGSQTALARSSEFGNTDDDPATTEGGTTAPYAADDNDAEEFLSIGELSAELRFVERAPRTPHAKVIARGA
jgi:hypothetical protein